jgi:hypothetical protein
MKYLSILLLLACSPVPCYPESGLSNFTSYQTPKEEPSLEIMAQLRQVEACLAPLKTTWLSDEEAKAAECYGRSAASLELRACMRVAVAPDWYTSTCTGEQVFNCSIGNARCLEKGITPTAECPCSCRAQIQDTTTIWITPNRKLLSAYAVTLLTGCLSPWTPTLVKCSNI